MKKNQFIAQSFAIIAAGFLAQACGSSSGNVSAVTATAAPTVSLPGTVVTGSPSQVYSSCSYYGGQTTTVTSNGVNVPVCRYEAASGVLPNMSAVNMNLSGSTASGGTITGLVLDAGDQLEVWSVGGYSPAGGVCDSGNNGGDISVIGNSSKDPTTNPANGEGVGLWFAFEGSSGQYSTPVKATVQYSGNYNQTGQYLSVPTSSTSSTLVMGYNWDGTIGCGTMDVYYAVIRCADASGNTYACN